MGLSNIAVSRLSQTWEVSFAISVVIIRFINKIPLLLSISKYCERKILFSYISVASNKVVDMYTICLPIAIGTEIIKQHTYSWEVGVPLLRCRNK